MIYYNEFFGIRTFYYVEKNDSGQYAVYTKNIFGISRYTPEAISFNNKDIAYAELKASAERNDWKLLADMNTVPELCW